MANATRDRFFSAATVLLVSTLLLSPCGAFISRQDIALSELSPSESQIRSPSIDHTARLAHANELLTAYGNAHSEAAARDAGGSVGELLTNKVFTALAPADRHRAGEIVTAIVVESARRKMDPLFLLAVIEHESRFAIGARGMHGEIGLMQIKPSTAAWIAARSGEAWGGSETLFDPATNIRLATAYLAFLRDRFAGQVRAYVGAYNMGPLNVRRLLSENIVPTIYADALLDKYRAYYGKLATDAPGPRVFSVSMHRAADGQVFGQIAN